jgi:hypothetical protein
VTPPGGAEPGTETPATPSPTTTEIEGVEHEVNVTVTTEDGSIALGGDEGAYVLPGMPVLVRVIAEDTEKIEDVSVTIGNRTYMPSEVSDGVYVVSAPIAGGVTNVTVITTYTDGETTSTVGLAQMGYGIVYEIVDDAWVPVSGALVTVQDWSGVNNPAITGSDGAVGWYAPNGSYTVRVEKEGYETKEVGLSVSNNVLAPNVELTKTAEEIIEEVIPGETIVPVVVSETVQVISQSVTQVATAVSDAVIAVRENQAVQDVATVATPVMVVSAVSSAAVLSTSFNLWPILQYLFTAPILFFARRRRQNFGIVYNSITKVPIDLAVVRLYDAQAKLVRTMVTDSDGRYFFNVDAGKYFIRVTKPGFTFPSAYLSGVKADGNFVDIYTQGYLEVTEQSVIIAANIPLDPVSEEGAKATKRIRKDKILRVFQNSVALAGIILAIYIVVIQPSAFSWLMLGVQVLLYVGTKLLIRPRKKKGWGIVYGAEDRSPIANAIVRLFEPKYHKLLETAITDRKGRYAFMVGPNEYYASFEKPGYETREVRPIDYRNKKELTPISVDVPLRRQV